MWGSEAINHISIQNDVVLKTHQWIAIKRRRFEHVPQRQGIKL